MFARIARSLVAFGVVVVAYQAYALLVVPLIEPGGTIQASKANYSFDPESSNPAEKYQRLLSAYFPANHWTQTGKPKVIETGQLMLVIDDYKRDNRGRVDLEHCAVVAFPTARTRGAPAPRDAVIVEAPGVVQLQFDKDFNPARGQIGRIVLGVFPGEITIRSDMQQPGPADDLLIRTRDLQINETRIYTKSDISFRLAGHRGRGREMDIVLMEEEHRRPGQGSLAFNGIRHLEIKQIDRLELQPGSIDLTGASKPHSRSSGADAWAGVRTPQPSPAAEAPIEVTCDESFLLSFLDFTATFHKNVVATQLSLSGQSDQLTCQELRIHFGESKDRLSPTVEPDLAREQRNVMAKLRPTLVHAIGQPVRIDSPSRSASVRCQSLQIEVPQRRLTLSGGAPTLAYGANQVSAPIIRYQHPAQDSNDAVGQLWLAGPGEIRVAPKADRPQESLIARWNAAPGIEYPVQLTRVNQQPVLMVEGRPQVSGTRLGRITSDRLRMVFEETAADGDNGPAIELNRSSRDAKALLAKRIDALGAVRIESPELDAQTSELIVHVKPEERSPALGDPRGTGKSLTSNRTTQAAKVRYLLRSQKMQMDLLTDGRGVTPANLVCVGGVQFAEDKPNTPRADMFAVEGERLTVSNLKSGEVDVRVDGAENPAAVDAALAQIVAKGLTLKAATVRLDQKTSRLWAAGAGSARIRAQRDLFGQATNASTDLHLRWRGGLSFDGKRITVREDVYGESAHDWVRCSEVIASLERPVDLSHGNGSGPLEIAQIDCRGGVTIDHRTVDAQGQSSHERARIETLSVNRTTGAIAGQGPGEIRSVRLGGGGIDSLTPGNTASSGKRGLGFLRVRFQRGIAGNLNNRQLSFLGDVQGVYGPILAWEQELPLNPPGQLAPETATLSCDQLTVNEDPLTGLAGASVARTKGLGPIELHARGNVVLRGAAEGQGLFTAYAVASSYSQSKEEIVLEGDNRTPATLFQQESPGAARRSSQAQKLTYWPATGRVKIDNFQQGGTGTAPTAARPAWPAGNRR